MRVVPPRRSLKGRSETSGARAGEQLQAWVVRRGEATEMDAWLEEASRGRKRCWHEDTVAPKVRAGLCCAEGDAATETGPRVVTLRFYFLT